MLRLVAPVANRGYYVVALSASWQGGIPSVLLFIPVTADEGPWEDDMFLHHSQKGVRQEHPYEKMEIEGEVVSKAIAFPSLYRGKKEKLPMLDALIQCTNGSASSSTGISFIPSPILDSISTSDPNGDFLWLGYSSHCNQLQKGRSGSGRVQNQNSVYDVDFNTNVSIKYSVDYTQPDPVLRVTLVETHTENRVLVGGPVISDQALHIKSTCSKSASLPLRRGSRAKCRIDTEATADGIHAWGHPTHWTKSYHDVDSYQEAFCYGTVVATEDGYIDFNRVLPPPEHRHAHMISGARKQIKQSIARTLGNIANRAFWSHIQEEALKDSIIISNNMFMFVRDMVDLKNYVQNVAESGDKLYRSIREDGVSVELAKAGANMYLPVKYGYGLTLAEANDIGNKIIGMREKYKNLFSKFQCRHRRELKTDFGTMRCAYLANVVVKDNAFSEVYASLYNTGFWMTLKNAWDFIPYSFCADWILSFSDLLESIDLYGYRCNLSLLSLFHTYILDKTPVRVIDLWPSLIGTVDDDLMVQLSYYDRQLLSEFDPPPFDLSTPLVDTDPAGWSHYTEAISLIIQRI